MLGELGLFVDRHSRTIMVTILVLVSMYYMVVAANTPYNRHDPDGEKYELLAFKATQAESLFSKGNFNGSYWSPGWVAGIGALYRLVGRNPAVVRIAVAYFALMGGFLIFRIAGEISGPRAGIVAATVFLLSSHVRLVIAHLQYEVPAAVLVLLVVGVVVFWNPLKDTGKRDGRLLIASVSGLYVAVGLVMGWTILMSPRTMLLALMVIACIWLDDTRSRSAMKTAAFAVGILLVLVPWTVRNYRCFGDFIPLTTNGGLNLYIGNNPFATNWYFVPDEGLRPPYTNTQSAEWTRAALQYMAENPGITIRRFATRLYLFWRPVYRDEYCIFAAFLIGLLRFGFRRPIFSSRSLWLVGAPIMMSLAQMIFFHQSRYVIVVWPYICIVAAVGLFGVGARAPERDSAARE